MERDIEKDLLEIEGAIRVHTERDNMFTVSVLQRCHKLVSQLKEYKDLEEQGKLLKLPCAVGDILYCDGKYFASHCEGGEIHSFKVSDIVTEIKSYYRGEVDYCFDFENVGKTVFLTREEAEAALKELERVRTAQALM